MTESKNLSLFRKILGRENPYSSILYTVKGKELFDLSNIQKVQNIIITQIT